MFDEQIQLLPMEVSEKFGKKQQQNIIIDLFSHMSSFEYDFKIVIFLENHDAVYIVGSLEETLLIRGMRYHPTDIENTVMRTHKRICEW